MTMNRPIISSLLSTLAIALALLAAPALALAAAPKTYQVTGPVLDVNDTTITVQKGKEKWEISRDKDTKVTIEYRMTATAVEVKGDAKAKGEKADKADKK